MSIELTTALLGTLFGIIGAITTLVILLLIARIANFTGRYRVVTLVALQVIVWLSVCLTVLLSDRNAGRISNFNPWTLVGIIVVLVIGLVLIGRVLARIIAFRYASSVADVLASVIICSVASFFTPVLTIYLSITGLSDTSNSLPSEILVNLQTLSTIFSLMGVLIFFTACSAWILMGWGSMPTLRRRKGTVLGLMCVAIAIMFSILLTLVLVQQDILISAGNPSIAQNGFFLLGIFGTISILSGMIAAGFMHGILESLVSLVDILAFIMALIIPIGVLTGTNQSYVYTFNASTAIKILTLIVALSVVRLRAAMIGQPIVSVLVGFMFIIPCLWIIDMIPTDSRLFIVLGWFILLMIWTGVWGIRLRHWPYAGIFSSTLQILVLALVPIVFLLP